MQKRSPLHEAKYIKKNTEAITRNYLMKQRSLIVLTFFNVKTNSVKQLWQNLASVASLRKPKNKTLQKALTMNILQILRL